MKPWPLLPLAATGCATLLAGELHADFTAQSGAAYYWRGSQFAPALVEEQEAWFLAKLAALHYPPATVATAMRAARIRVYPDKIACSDASPTGYCNGVQSQEQLQVRNMGCPFSSALTHEEAHWIREAVLGDPDSEHKDAALWAIADGAPRACPQEVTP